MARYALAAVVVLLCIGDANGQVGLKWKLKQGDTSQLTTEATTRTDTITTDQFGNKTTEKETDQQSVVRTVKVSQVTDKGNYKLVMTIDRMTQQTKSSTQTMKLDARRDEQGKPKVTIDLKSANPAAAGADVQRLLKKVGQNMLDVKMYFELTPSGQVVSANNEGDPFADLPTDTLVTRLITQSLKKMLDPKDLTQTVAAEGFTQLSDKPVRVDDTWPLKRQFGLMGLQLVGSGTAKLASVDQVGDGQHAKLSEKVTYKVTTTKFNKMMKQMMEQMMQQLGVQAQFDVNLKSKGDLDSVSTTVFDVTGGHTRTSTWDNLKMGMGGNMIINVLGQRTTVNLDLTVNVTTKNTWQKK